MRRTQETRTDLERPRRPNPSNSASSSKNVHWSAFLSSTGTSPFPSSRPRGTWLLRLGGSRGPALFRNGEGSPPGRVPCSFQVCFSCLVLTSLSFARPLFQGVRQTCSVSLPTSSSLPGRCPGRAPLYSQPDEAGCHVATSPEEFYNAALLLLLPIVNRGGARSRTQAGHTADLSPAAQDFPCCSFDAFLSALQVSLQLLHIHGFAAGVFELSGKRSAQSSTS